MHAISTRYHYPYRVYGIFSQRGTLLGFSSQFFHAPPPDFAIFLITRLPLKRAVFIELALEILPLKIQQKRTVFLSSQ